MRQRRRQAKMKARMARHAEERRAERAKAK
jgi:hypothetical protein